MTSQAMTEWLILIIGIWFVAKGVIFGVLYTYPTATARHKRTPFGFALRSMFLGLAITSIAIGPIFLLRYVSGPDNPRIEPEWLASMLRILLLGGLAKTTWHSVFVLKAAIERKRSGRDVAISHDGVFGSLAQAMPIIVADHTGTIQYTTAELDALAGAMPNELYGKNIQTLMPERYQDSHQEGLDRYVRTRDPHIVGTVVSVDMLRRDGTEIPVYLALNSTDVDGKPWFVASLWSRARDVPEVLVSSFSDDTAQTIIATHDDVSEVKADVKELKQRMDGS